MYDDLERLLTWISTLGFILPFFAFYLMKGVRKETFGTITLRLLLAIIIIAGAWLFSWLTDANAIRFF